MRVRPTRVPVPLAGNGADSRGFHALGAAFLEAEAVRGRTPATLRTLRQSLSLFILWCGDRNLGRPLEITRPILERYQRHLFQYRKQDGRPLSFRTQASRLSSLRTFFRWLVRRAHLPSNPAADLDMPQVRRNIPRDVLTPAEAERVLAVPEIATATGLRDRAVLETLYSTAIRRAELCHLTIFDIDRERGTLFVHQGKGRKDRVVPIGERAVAWIDRYLADARPELAVPGDNAGVLFLSNLGNVYSPDRLTHDVRAHVKKSGVGKQGACHLFRHTVATIMLENGADIRFIQQLLGHENLQTTQIYTQVSIKKLKEIHTATHPAAKLERKPAAAKEESSDDPLKAELLDELSAEADEEDSAK